MTKEKIIEPLRLNVKSNIIRQVDGECELCIILKGIENEKETPLKFILLFDAIEFEGHPEVTFIEMSNINDLFKLREYVDEALNIWSDRLEQNIADIRKKK